MRRKRTLLTFVGILLPVAAFGQGNTQVQPVALGHDLSRIINLAEREGFPPPPSYIRDPLSFSLYSIGVQGSCVEDTHWVCSHDYYLAMRGYGEYPEHALFHLGRLGEITEIAWLPRWSNRLRLKIRVANYPSALLERSNLVARYETFELTVRPDSTRQYHLDVRRLDE